MIDLGQLYKIQSSATSSPQLFTCRRRSELSEWFSVSRLSAKAMEVRQTVFRTGPDSRGREGFNVSYAACTPHLRYSLGNIWSLDNDRNISHVRKASLEPTYTFAIHPRRELHTCNQSRYFLHRFGSVVHTNLHELVAKRDDVWNGLSRSVS